MMTKPEKGWLRLAWAVLDGTNQHPTSTTPEGSSNPHTKLEGPDSFSVGA